jgi:hypothetical protein
MGAVLVVPSGDLSVSLVRRHLYNFQPNARLGYFMFTRIARAWLSTETTTTPTSVCKSTYRSRRHDITILEFPAISSCSSSSSSAHNKQDATQEIDSMHKDGSDMKGLRCYTFSNQSDSWIFVTADHENDNNNHKKRLLTTFLYERFLCHFLPRGFPQTVDVGYLSYSMYTFLANVAGSASMVLSTQTLLLAVGVVGHHHQDDDHSVMQAGVMAGALNWVLKDGVGQLGGIAFASYVAKRTHNLDSNPKQWRLLAAVALDAAAFMELSAPFLSSSYSVLALACVANIFKNIGFLTASASRAALHQALAGVHHNNLADVTAKSGSQAMAAGLVGTGLGIVLSQWIVHADPTHFMAAFGVLALFHQGFNYLALRNVVLRQFDARRLTLVMDAFLTSGKVLTPEQAAQQERFWWWHDQPYNNSKKGEIRIGRKLFEVSPSIQQLEQMTSSNHQRRYYYLSMKCTNDKHASENIVHLVYLDGASGHDIIQGFFHASLLLQSAASAVAIPQTQMGRDDVDFYHTNSEETAISSMSESFPNFLSQLQLAGWRTNTESTRHVEPSDAIRWSVRFPSTNNDDDTHL